MFLVVINTFSKTQIYDSTHNGRVIVSMLIPSVILLISSILVAAFILRRLIKELNTYMEKLNEYCGLILKDDVGLEIEKHDGTYEIEELFSNLDILNQLNKYVDPSYFSQLPKP